jgi:hypothetical protein
VDPVAAHEVSKDVMPIPIKDESSRNIVEELSAF